MDIIKNKESIKKYLWGTWDRKFTLTSLLVTVISFFITIYLYKFPEKLPRLIIIRDVSIIVSFFAIFGILISKYIVQEQHLFSVIERLKYSNFLLKKIYEKFHWTNHKFRDEVFRYFYTGNPLVFCNKDRRIFEKICHSITTDVKATFAEYFKAKQVDVKDDDITVTIKICICANDILTQNLYLNKIKKEDQDKISEQEDKKWIVTLFRDPGSYEKYKGKREIGVTLYDINRNTAFMKIFREKKPLFKCDNLEALGDSYLNENTSWKKFYNSTAVAPIRFYDQQYHREEKYAYFGLIAIDSLNKKNYPLYENEETEQILGHAADLLANYFLLISCTEEYNENNR